MGSLVAELAEKLSAATNSLDFDEQTMFLNTSANTVGIGTNAPASKLDVRGTMQVGLDGTGYDVKFCGDTASAYMLWDESADDLILAGAARVVIPDGQLVLGSTAVSSTAAELNRLDGIGSTVVGLTDSQTLTNKTLTSPVLNTGVSGTAVLDEDNMTSDSATQLATQQSIKAYTDATSTAMAIALG